MGRRHVTLWHGDVADLYHMSHKMTQADRHQPILSQVAPLFRNLGAPMNKAISYLLVCAYICCGQAISQGTTELSSKNRSMFATNEFIAKKNRGHP